MYTWTNDKLEAWDTAYALAAYANDACLLSGELVVTHDIMHLHIDRKVAFVYRVLNTEQLKGRRSVRQARLWHPFRIHSLDTSADLAALATAYDLGPGDICTTHNELREFTESIVEGICFSAEAPPYELRLPHGRRETTP